MVLSGNSGPKVALTHSDWAEFIDYTLEHHKYSSLQDAGYFIGEPKDHVEFRSTTDSGMSGGAASGANDAMLCPARISRNRTAIWFEESLSRCINEEYRPRFININHVSWKSKLEPSKGNEEGGKGRKIGKNQTAPGSDPSGNTTVASGGVENQATHQPNSSTDSNAQGDAGHTDNSLNANSTAAESSDRTDPEPAEEKAAPEVINDYLAFALIIPGHPFSDDLYNSLRRTAPLLPKLVVTVGDAREFSDLCTQLGIQSFPKLLLIEKGFVRGNYADEYSPMALGPRLAHWVRQEYPAALPRRFAPLTYLRSSSSSSSSSSSRSSVARAAQWMAERIYPSLHENQSSSTPHRNPPSTPTQSESEDRDSPAVSPLFGSPGSESGAATATDADQNTNTNTDTDTDIDTTSAALTATASRAGAVNGTAKRAAATTTGPAQNEDPEPAPAWDAPQAPGIGARTVLLPSARAREQPNVNKSASQRAVDRWMAHYDALSELSAARLGPVMEPLAGSLAGPAEEALLFLLAGLYVAVRVLVGAARALNAWRRRRAT